jgi:hypothetical protein
MIPVVYIAGPYRASNAWVIEHNIRRAEVMALRVWQLGGVALCPHTMTRFYQGALPDGVWLAGDLELVRRSDAVFAIDRWQQSAGAQAEVAYAQVKQIPIFESLEQLAVWIAKVGKRGNVPVARPPADEDAATPV